MGQGRSILPATSHHQYHHPTFQDVSQVRKHLTKYLPLELADEILQQAEYWPRLVSHVQEDIHVAAMGPRSEASVVYFASEKL